MRGLEILQQVQPIERSQQLDQGHQTAPPPGFHFSYSRSVHARPFPQFCLRPVVVQTNRTDVLPDGF